MKVTFEINAHSTLRWILGLLLVWAGVSKLGDLQNFYGAMLAYGLPIPSVLLRIAAATLPWLELLCGLMLLARFRTYAALLWAAVLFAVFTVATGQAWARGLEISCGCVDLTVLGIAPDSSVALVFKAPWFAFVRAVVLLAAVVFLLVRTEPEPACAGVQAKV